MEFSFLCVVLGRVSHILFPSSHSGVVELSRSGALQEAEAQIGMYYFIAVGTSFYFKEIHLNIAAPLLTRDHKALRNLA